MKRLKEMVAVVTGGARGIGRQIALSYAGNGASIVVGDILEMKAVEEEVRSLGRDVITIRTDVSDKEAVKKLIGAAIDRFGKVDILVNVAGISRRSSLVEMREEDWDIVMNVNLKGVFLCSQAVAKHMIERRYGKIINVSAIAGLTSIPPGGIAYAPSKAGVIQLTRVCALELGRYGINVNAIAPGIVLTEFIYTGRTRSAAERFIEERSKLTALGRAGTPQDIANLAVFLGSDESSFITGQVIAADGGRVGLS